MAEPIRFGIVGSGFMGRTWARVIVRHAAEARLVAVAGGRRASDLAAEHGVATLDAEGLFERDDIDAVVIATPVPTHRRLVEAAVAAGRHVLVEKPMSATRAEAQAMVEAADRAGVRLAVVSQHRFRAAPRAARQLIDAGTIGPSRMIRVTGPTAGWDVPPDAWQSDRRQVSPFVDWGAHACDLVRWLTGAEPVLAFAAYASFTGTPPADQSAMAQYTMASGALVQLWLTYEVTPGLGSALQLLITGSSGIIELDSYGSVRVADTSGSWQTVFEQPPFNPLDPDDSVRLQAYAAQLADLIVAIRDGHDPVVSGREGLLTMAMLEAAEQSAATGEAVRLTPGPGHDGG